MVKENENKNDGAVDTTPKKETKDTKGGGFLGNFGKGKKDGDEKPGGGSGEAVQTEKKETPPTPSTLPTSPTPPKQPTPPAEEKVEVPKSVLEEVLRKQKDMEGQIDSLQSENKKLTAVADKSRLAWYEQQNSDGNLIQTYRVGVYTDYEDRDKDDNAMKRIVLGWKLIKDEVRFVNKVLTENQVYRLFLDQGEGKEAKQVDINIYDFTRELEREKGELIKEAKTSDSITKTLRFADGREIEFDVRFLNP